MAKKRIKVNGGDIYINWPEDSEKFLAMYRRIQQYLSEANKKISCDNEKCIDLEFRKKASEEFDGFFGEGSCVKVFGSNMPGFRAFTEFIMKLEKLTEQWE